MHQLASEDGQASSPPHKKKKPPAYGTGTARGWGCSAMSRNTGETTEHHSNTGMTNQNSAGAASTQCRKKIQTLLWSGVPQRGKAPSPGH